MAVKRRKLPARMPNVVNQKAPCKPSQARAAHTHICEPSAGEKHEATGNRADYDTQYTYSRLQLCVHVYMDKLDHVSV